MPIAIGLALLGLAKLVLSGRLLINFTPSIPRGIYWISPGETPRRGDLVTFPIPESVRELLYARGYVPRSIKLLAKPVAAVGGDHVCVQGHHLFVNGEPAGNVLDADREGRPMPRHPVCAPLPRGAVFLSTGHDNSFDSRNFGPIDTAQLRGRLTPLFTF